MTDIYRPMKEMGPFCNIIIIMIVLLSKFNLKTHFASYGNFVSYGKLVFICLDDKYKVHKL